MTPEQIQKMDELERRVQDLERYIEQRNIQQVQLPLDPASVAVIARALQDDGYIIT